MKREKKSTTRLLALFASVWTLSFLAFGGHSLLTAETATREAPRQDEEEDNTFVTRWCEDHQISFLIHEVLSEQEKFIEELLSDHHERVTSVRERYEAKRAESLAEKDALRGRLLSDLDDFLNDQRKKGDPREIIEPLREILLVLREGHGGPVVLNPFEKPKKRGGKRTVTLQGNKHTIDTKTFGGHSYALLPGIRNWLDAKRWCEDRGGYLTCVETREEMEFLGRELIGLEEPATPRLDAMQPYRLNYWVGASDSRKNGSWWWLSGSSVDMDLFHRNGVPAQPSDFPWGEHHGGLVVYLHPDREDPEVGLIDWNLASNSRAICEWGRTSLPEPWDILTEEEVDELLVPFWKDLEKIKMDFQGAWKKLESGVQHRKQVRAFQRSIDNQREALGERLEKLRRESVRAGDDLFAATLKDLAGGLDLGGLDCTAPLLSRGSTRSDYRLVGRAFGKSYIVIREQMTFHDAEDLCRELGGQLPSPKSSLELDLLRYVLEMEEGISETWLAIVHHPYGSRSGWRSSRRELGEHSPKWMRDLLEEAEVSSQGLYAHGLVLPLAGTKGTSEDEQQSRDPYMLNSQLRRPFLCVIEGL